MPIEQNINLCIKAYTEGKQTAEKAEFVNRLQLIKRSKQNKYTAIRNLANLYCVQIKKLMSAPPTEGIRKSIIQYKTFAMDLLYMLTESSAESKNIRREVS